MTPQTHDQAHGLVLRPFRALRPTVDGTELGTLLCPPYDVIDAPGRARLLAGNADNAVAIILPETDTNSGADAEAEAEAEAEAGQDRYSAAAQLLERWVENGLDVVDELPALYVYEMKAADGSRTRGLVGAVELRDPADGVILPHENTMAGPVADRLALMSATEANLEPIYLVYDGGGAASAVVGSADAGPLLARTTTPDGIVHSLWAITDPATHAQVAADLATRRALIADGHHRYATYRELQARLDDERGAGAWDYGLTLLVDSTTYGPQVHAIHRYLVGVSVADAAEQAATWGVQTTDATDPADGLRRAEDETGFAVVLSDGVRTVLLTDPAGRLSQAIRRADEPAALADLDVTVLHRGLVETVWELDDSVDVVGYAHTVDEAIKGARDNAGAAIILRPTPVAAVAAVAAAGARMPRKSTLFTPKPASGLLMRRFRDE